MRGEICRKGCPVTRFKNFDNLSPPAIIFVIVMQRCWIRAVNVNNLNFGEAKEIIRSETKKNDKKLSTLENTK